MLRGNTGMPTIFISHRSEYARQACALREAIDKSSGGKCQAFVSSDLAPGTVWLDRLKEKLQEARVLILLYGAPYEDWTWCFYEVGYFSALMENGESGREILCTTRDNIDPPGPLHNIQMVRSEKQLTDALGRYLEKYVDVDRGTLKDLVSSAYIFGDVSEYFGYSRTQLLFTASACGIPDDARLVGDKAVLSEHFGFLSEEVRWSDIRDSKRNSSNEQIFYDKWLSDIEECISFARNGQLKPSQALLYSLSGLKPTRWLLLAARNQADGDFCCDFLVAEEIGGLSQSLPRHKVVLLTAIRMAFRFRYELIDRFKNLPEEFTPEQWSETSRAIRGSLTHLLTEADTRGITAAEELLDMIREEPDREATAEILGFWPTVQDTLYPAIGLKASQDRLGFRYDDTLIIAQPEAIRRLKLSLKGLDDLNRLFLHFCCKTLSQVQALSGSDVDDGLSQLRERIQDLRRNLQSRSWPDHTSAEPVAPSGLRND